MSNVEINEKGIPEITDKTPILAFCEKILKERKKTDWELSVLFCGNSFIKELNKKFRGVDLSTDVLSFPQENQVFKDGVNYAGDIVISIEKLEENIIAESITKNEGMKRLLIHGILHLEGMDHKNDYEKDDMLIIQEQLMKKYAGENIF